MRYYVTMTDKFLGGWGRAEGKIAKFVYVCDSLEEAGIIEQNAKDRHDQKNINVVIKKPYYNKERYLVQYKTKEVDPKWYVKNYFKKEAR